MNKRKVLGRALWITAALVIACAALCLLWENGVFLPRWVRWESKTLYDSSGAYRVGLADKEVNITHNDFSESKQGIAKNDVPDTTVVWASPKGMKVQDVLICDIDSDGADELLLLCWKIGRFGPHKPFWVEKDEHKWSQHIAVYEWNGEVIKQEWVSSYIGLDVVNMRTNDKEAPHTRLLLTDTDGDVSSWVWDSWGFTKEDANVSFAVFGDNLMHEAIYRYGLNNGKSFDFLFENMEDVISESDVAVINQETPLVDDPVQYSGYPRFGTPIEAGQAIVDAGFDVVTCATNHALDKGPDGVNSTKDFFASAGVYCLGIQSEEETEYIPYETIMRKGIRFALLNYTYGTNGIRLPDDDPNMVHLLDDEDKVKEDIEKAKSEADFVIVFAHWGTEDSTQIDGFQQKWAKIFLDSGVDVVVGTHPHVLQTYEVFEGGDGHRMLVYYSIGNYISAQPERSCVKGGMASFTVSLTPAGYEITEYALQPLSITRQEGGSYSVDFAPTLDGKRRVIISESCTDI